MIGGEELAKKASAWFRTLAAWPDPKPSVTAKSLAQVAHEYQEPEAYLAVAAVLLMLIATNDDAWPPMHPQMFADHVLSDKRFPSQVERYAKNIAIEMGTRR